MWVYMYMERDELHIILQLSTQKAPYITKNIKQRFVENKEI